MNDLISIVLPVYNGAKYLRESIESVLSQTYPYWELLIVDDCSIDDTPMIAREYEQKDVRIHYFRNEQNLKLPRNLNKGFALAKGDYLTWTSDDNCFRPDALNTMLHALKSSNDAQFAFASCRIIDGNGKEVEYHLVSDEGRKSIVGTNSVGACFLYTRNVYETVGEYDPNMILVEDFDYWQRIMMHFEAVAIPEILYNYRWHSDALTSTMRKDQFNTNLEKMLLKNISGFGKLDVKQKYYFYSALYKCRKNLQDKDNPYAKRYFVYNCWYFITNRVPGKLKRMWKNILGKVK